MRTKLFKHNIKSYSSRVTLEQLEERIVLDASVPATSLDNPDNAPETQVEQNPGNSNAPEAQSAPTQAAAEASNSNNPVGQIFNSDVNHVLVSSDLEVVETLAPESVRAIVVSSDIQDRNDLLGAIQDNVITITYDAGTSNPESILSAIQSALSGRVVDSIGFVSHDNGAGAFNLSDGLSVSLASLSADPSIQNFWSSVGQFVRQDGRIDILACDVASTPEGLQLVSQIESLSGRNVAASSDLTGNPDFGGNWELETDKVSLVPTYFDPDEILKFDGRLATFNLNGVNQSGLTYTEGATIDLDPENNISLTVNQNYTATLQLNDFSNAGSLFSLVGGSNVGSYDPITGIWSFTGTRTQVQNALRGASFDPNDDYDQPVNITLTVTENSAGDGAVTSRTQNISIDVTPLPDPPTLDIADNSFIFTVGKTDPVQLGAGNNITVNDPDTGDILTARLSWNKLAGSLNSNQGADGDGVHEFIGNKAAVNAFLGSLEFVPKAGWGKDTNLTISLKDSDGADFDVTKEILLQKNYQTTVEIPANLNATRSYIEGYDHVFLPALKIVDADANETVTVRLTLDNLDAGYLTSKANYSKDAIYNPATGVWEYTGTVSKVNTMLGRVVFVPGYDNDNDVDSHISVQITDGKSTPVTGNITLDITPVNDQPEFLVKPPDVISYAENSPTVPLGPIVITDPDTGENDLTATVKVYDINTGGLHSNAGGAYSVVKINGQWVGVWSVTGNQSAVNNALAGLVFIPSVDNDDHTTLSVEITDHGDNTVTRKEYFSLHVIPAPGQNDAVEANFFINGATKPLSFSPTVEYKEDFSNIYLPAIVVSDDDPGDKISATFTLTSSGIPSTDVRDIVGYIESYGGAKPLNYLGNGVWELKNLSVEQMNYALGHLKFQPDDYNDHNANLNISITDGNGPNVEGNIFLKVKPVNDQPVFTDTPDKVIMFNEGGPAFVLKTVKNGVDHFFEVNDPDTNEKLTATITLADTASGSFISDYNFGGPKSIVSNAQGIWTITNKTVEEVNLALENLKFVPDADNEQDSWFSVEVRDGGENGTFTQYREFTLAVNPTNDQVEVNNPAAIAYANMNSPSKTELALPDIKVSDKDTNEIVKATFTVNIGPEYASLTRFSGITDNLYDSVSGQWVYEGSIQNLNAAIKDLKFVREDGFLIPPGSVLLGGGTSISVTIEDGLENGKLPIEGVIYIADNHSFWELI